MRLGIITFVFLAICLSTVGQTATPFPAPTATPEYSVRVVVDSAFVRELPGREFTAVASVMENDVLYALGRNADGSWIQVRRPWQEVRLGWIFKDMTQYAFEMAQLPLADLTTGVTGSDPVYDTGITVFILNEVSLRSRAHRGGERLAIVPVGLTIPAIERTPDNMWVRVNYLGITGWVAEFLVRISGDSSTLPVSPEYATSVIPIEIVPPEVQLAQVYRLREFVAPKYAVAHEVVEFWDHLNEGDTVPCYPPAVGDYPHYAYTPRDIVELPELRTMVNNLPYAIDDLNAALNTMQRCGAYTPTEISVAYAQAINATSLLGSILGRLDYLEQNVIH